MSKDDKQVTTLLPPDLQQRLERANLEVLDEYRRRLERQARLAECIRARYPASERKAHPSAQQSRGKTGLRLAAIVGLAFFAVPGALLLTSTHSSVANAQEAAVAPPAPLVVCADGEKKPEAKPAEANQAALPAPPATGTSNLPSEVPSQAEARPSHRSFTGSIVAAIHRPLIQPVSQPVPQAAPQAAPQAEPAPVVAQAAATQAPAPVIVEREAPKAPDLSVAARTANLLREQLGDTVH